jgi:hypothetical protein
MKSAISVSEYKRKQIIYYINNYEVNVEYLSDVTYITKQMFTHLSNCSTVQKPQILF